MARRSEGIRRALRHPKASAIGPGGFEPPLTDPKSAVLPLDEGPEGQYNVTASGWSEQRER